MPCPDPGRAWRRYAGAGHPVVDHRCHSTAGVVATAGDRRDRGADGDRDRAAGGGVDAARGVRPERRRHGGARGRTRGGRDRHRWRCDHDPGAHPALGCHPLLAPLADLRGRGEVRRVRHPAALIPSANITAACLRICSRRARPCGPTPPPSPRRMSGQQRNVDQR